MLSYRPNELRAAFPEQPVRHQELRRAPMSTHHGIKCSVRMPNVMDAPPFKAGASTRTLSSSEVQVRVGGIESNDRGTKMRMLSRQSRSRRRGLADPDRHRQIPKTAPPDGWSSVP